MAEPKTVPTDASVDDFIEAQADPARRDACRQLVAVMRKATRAEPVLWGSSIVGFGRYSYRYASGHSGDWPLVGFSPRKNDLTLYLMDGFEGREELLARLGRHKTGKSCLYLKSLDGIDRAVLQQLVDASVKAVRARYPAA